MMKKFVIIAGIALIHFGASVLIVASAMSLATALDPVPAEPASGFRMRPCAEN